MQKILPRILILAAVLAVLSCARRVEHEYDSVKWADNLVADSLPQLQGLASVAGRTAGAIALVGDPVMCLETAEALLSADAFDNGSGRPVPDGLPDFAGETIVPILHLSDSLLAAGSVVKDSLAFREAVLRNAIFALDTTCLVSPYDADSTFSKPALKVLLVCSPDLARRGAADIRDLFARIGCAAPVLASADTAYSFTASCYSLLRKKNLFTHHIAYPIAKLYMTVSARAGRPGCNLIQFSRRFAAEPFADTVQVLAPKTMESYVQNQYQP